MAMNAELDNLFRRISFSDDQEAFRELFFDFYPALCVYAKRYVSSPEACEDIVQDAFFSLWKNRKKLEITTSFRNLLITTVKNCCVDYLRKQSVRQNHLDNYTLPECTDSPEEIFTINELEDILYGALDRLPQNVRTAFMMNRFENLTYKKIAEEMHVSPKTVEAYISKALVMLRIELKDYLPLALLSCRFFLEQC